MKYYITFNPDMGYIGIKSDLSYQETIEWIRERKPCRNNKVKPD